MIKSQENNPKSSFGRDYVEKYIIKVDRKFLKKKIQTFFKNLTGSFSLPEELYVTAKSQEGIKNLTVSETLSIILYLRHRIKQMQMKSKQYSLLSKITVGLFTINLLRFFLISNPTFISINYAVAIILMVVFYYLRIKISTFRYYKLQYTLIQSYFDQESVDK